MKVAVLGGGISSEHEVSLRSAASVAGGLREAGHETVEVTIDRDGRWSAGGGEIAFSPAGGLLECEVAFPVLHGPGGEDGSVQGLLEVLGVPYAGSDVESSAICMDKLVFKDLLARHGVPQVEYCRAGEEDWKAIASGFGQPVWVKPARLGSSVGISPASGEEELGRAVEQAARHDPRVIVEAPAPGKEVECSLLGNEDPVAFTARRDRHQGTRLVRLRGEVRRGRHGARGPGSDLRGHNQTTQGSGPSGVHALRLQRAGAL